MAVSTKEDTIIYLSIIYMSYIIMSYVLNWKYSPTQLKVVELANY